MGTQKYKLELAENWIQILTKFSDPKTLGHAPYLSLMEVPPGNILKISGENSDFYVYPSLSDRHEI